MKAATARPPETRRPSATASVVPEFKSKPREEDFVRHTFYAQERGIKELKYWALIDDRGQSEILREALGDWLSKRQAAE